MINHIFMFNLDFCYARQTEKEDLMKQVQQNIVSNSSGIDARQPPPRPPPPQAQQQTPSAPIPPPQYINPTQCNFTSLKSEHYSLLSWFNSSTTSNANALPATAIPTESICPILYVVFSFNINWRHFEIQTVKILC